MKILTILPVLAALYLLLRLTRLKISLPAKLIVNVLCGYGCVLLINLFSHLTDTTFSLNIVTAVVVGFLGLPGIALLFLIRFLIL